MRALSASVLLTLALTGAASAQTTWYVDVNGTPPGTGTQLDPYTSLQGAIAQAMTLSGDTLLVLPGTYVEQIDFLGKDLVVQSTAGAATTILDGGGNGPVVTFAAGETAAAMLDGFTVQNGDSRNGGFVNEGGGVECDGASPTLVNLVVRDNLSLTGGGLKLSNGSTATLTNSVVRDNDLALTHGDVSFSAGGGVWSSCDSAPFFTRVDFIHNERARGGGAYGSGTFIECLFDDNNGPTGAGMHVPAGCTTQVFGSTFRNGFTCVDSDCSPGGAVFGPAQVFDTLIEDNFGASEGGAVRGATLTRCTLRRNFVGSGGGHGGWGGAAFNSTLIECLVEDNEANGLHPLSPEAARGGGIYNCTATDCTIRNNRATRGRGGAAFGSILIRCDVYGNLADPVTTGAPASGGGVADCTSSYTTIHGNTATNGGGVSNGASVTCTVYGNTATSGSGGGVEAGIVTFPGNATLRNTIVRGNSGTQLLATNGAINATYCDVEGGAAGTGNFDADPSWFDAANADFHLRLGSPCIDAGDPSEQDPDGSIRDVGAFPYDPTYAPGAEGYCYGNAVDCPCGNGGSGAGGCDLPQATGGVALTVEDFLPNGAGGGSAKLVGSGFPAATAPTVIVIRSPAAQSPPAVLGDGLRCIGTSGLVRLGSTTASGGASQRTLTHAAGAGTFFYQLWFRSTPATFCDPSAAFNLSNGLSIPWP